MSQPDYSDDILNYLRERGDDLTLPLTMATELTQRISDRGQSRQTRGKILSCLTQLIRQKKVIRYRKVTMVKRRPRSAQGFIRISELHR